MMSYSKQDPESIQALFNDIARTYDRTNQILSFSLHKSWNQTLIQKTIKEPINGSLLDLCGGTGEIAFSYLQKQSQKKDVYILDFSSQMLHFAKDKQEKLKLSKHNVHYLKADAQAIPLPDESVSYITLAYGIRNVKDPSLCFSECERVLKKGGRLGILELTEPKNPLLRLGHICYLRTVLPLVGRLVTKNRNAYEYLQQSIKAFIKPNELAALLKEQSFQNIQTIPLTAGIATLFLADKAS